MAPTAVSSTMPLGAPQATAPEKIRPRPMQGEAGVSGTAIWGGEPAVETNEELYGQLGYGVPGTREWGAWERLGKTDPDIALALEFVCAQIRDARVDVEPAKEDFFPDRKLAQAQADFCRWNLLEACEPGWAEVLQQMARGILPGFALHELCWGDVAHPALPGGKGLGVVKLAERLPVSVHQNGWLEADGDLVAVKQTGQRTKGTTTEWVMPELPAEKLSLFSWNRSGSNYLGVSAFRPAYYLAKTREHMLKVLAIGVVRESAGVPVATAADGAQVLTSDQRAALEQLLANLVYHENASIVMPKGWSLDWIYSPGANKGHVLDAWKALGEVILRLVFAQQLVLGVNGTGSRAVGDTHAAQGDVFVQGVVAAIEGVLNGVGSRKYTGLVRKLVEANWGPQAAYPKLRITLKKAKLSVKELTEAASVAKGAGLLTVTIDDENSVREALGLEPIDEATRLANKPAPPLMLPAVPSPNGPAAPPVPARIPSVGGQPGLSASAPRGLFIPSRPLRASEKHLDLTRMDSFLAGGRDRFEKLVRPVVAEMLMKAAPDITKALADGDPSDVHLVPLDTVRLDEAVGRFLTEARAEGQTQVKQELERGLAEDVANARRDVALKAAAGDGGVPREPDTIFGDKTLENIKRALVRRITGRLGAQLETEAIDVVRTGGDASEVVRNTLTEQLDTGAFKADAGVAMTRVWNVGREEGAELMGGVDQVEYSAILDSATCGPCQSKDGQRYDFNSAEHDDNLPPNRDCDGGGNCRCCLIFLPRGDA